MVKYYSDARTLQKARELAESGEYQDVSEIAEFLVGKGYAFAPRLLAPGDVAAELSAVCAEAVQKQRE